MNKDTKLAKLTKATVALTDKIGPALAPIFDAAGDQPEAIQNAMVLMTMRTIQATTHEEDWNEAARQSAMLLIAVMENGFLTEEP